MLCKRVAIIREGVIVQVEDIENLRKKQLKKIHIEFKDSGSRGKFSIAGMENIVAGPGNNLSFMFSGDLNELISKISGEQLINIMIEEPSLEEIFMHYYK